ncbi:hypothetical protein IVA87_32025 [Bradyrhizobium sp. 147]|uniref:hypothetical protein n=1 Tax=unclassified Bradyrhizobium TaxID=2631580 RepID=UPI001FF74BE0|nr:MULTISPECIES: hypothetical protein [unclassified Bradyrhizobium]MCK1495044.1 hypothetical protein [Bradyrhizobium sp. 180]MCK1683885.1 hypothetical protein [Bradyrhizobium sp. 147]
MRKKFLPPDFESHRITHRLDGYVVNREGEMPRAVADAMFDAALGCHGEVERIRRRMLLRQHEYEFAKRVMKARERRFKLARKA